MKILFTADLHLNIQSRSRQTGRTSFDLFAELVNKEDPQVVVVAGDIGIPALAGQHLAAIRKVVGDRILAVALGNHDFWANGVQPSPFNTLDQIVTHFWQEPVREAGAVLLDRENLDLGEIVIVGGYGHFDLGLAHPDLKVTGVRITEEIYLAGGIHGVYWNDFIRIPNCATSVQAEAREQAAGIASRLDQAIKGRKRILVATHTCPWGELNGHPRIGNESDLFTAYCGNSLLGTELKRRAESVEFLMCGHTHMAVKERVLHGIRCLNVGADYGVFRGVIYQTDTQEIQWIGEPLPCRL